MVERDPTMKNPSISGIVKTMTTEMRLAGFAVPSNMYLYPTMAIAPTKYTIPNSANMVVGIVHIINTGFESDLSLRAAAADRNFLKTSHLFRYFESSELHLQNHKCPEALD